jgi:hypothetical protein
MVLGLRDPKNSTRKLSDLINTFSKVAGYTINAQNYLYVINSQKVIRKTIPFTIASKVSRNKLTKKGERPVQCQNL